MATIKAYTDLAQSKKLAEILPLESADMHWQYIEEDDGQLQWFCFPKDFSINQQNTVSAWSLAALLSVLPIPSLHQTEGKRWYCNAEPNRLYFSNHCDNPIDACVDMIERLHELNLL